jgi:cobalt-zinc-cadmium efflux system membrane fusion protein
MKKIIALACAAFLALSACHKDQSATAANKTPPDPDTLHYAPGADQLNYLAIAPAQELIEPTLQTLPGRLVYDEDYTVRVFSPVLGRVTKLVAQPGTSVKAGDALAWLDSSDFALARADARKADADIAVKRKALQRTEELTKLGVIAQKDLEAARADLAQAEAERDRASSVLKNLDPSGASDRYALRAAIGGIVVDRSVNPGMEVRPDATTPLFIITDPAHLWCSFELSEQDMGKVHNGQHVRIDVDAFPDTHFSGHIIYVGAALDPSTRRISVRAAVDDPDARLKPEMFARVSPLVDDDRKQVAVPNSALVSVGLKHYVFVEKSPGVLQRRAVETGVVGEKDAFIASGLKAGERVVTRGAVLLNGELGQGD